MILQMDREKLMKMAGAVRTGGKGTVRRWGLLNHTLYIIDTLGCFWLYSTVIDTFYSRCLMVCFLVDILYTGSIVLLFLLIYCMLNSVGFYYVMLLMAISFVFLLTWVLIAIDSGCRSWTHDLIIKPPPQNLHWIVLAWWQICWNWLFKKLSHLF